MRPARATILSVVFLAAAVALSSLLSGCAEKKLDPATAAKVAAQKAEDEQKAKAKAIYEKRRAEHQKR